MRRVAIVGAGIAGLALAQALKRHSASAEEVEILILERSDRPGGNIRSETIDGYMCEWGPNGFLDNVPATLDLVSELRIEDRLQISDDAARRRFIYRDGKLHQLPENPIDFLRSRLLSWPGKLRILGEPFATRRPDDDETIHAFASRRIGREAAHVLVGSMVSGVFAGDATRLSLRACFPKMWQMETDHGGLFRAMLALRKKKNHQPGGAIGAPAGRLTSFRNGTEELVRALADEAGKTLATGARVTDLQEDAGRNGARTRPRFTLCVNKGVRFEADAVVLTGHAHESAAILECLDTALASLLRAIDTAPLVVVCLGYDVARLVRPLDGFGFLVPRGEGPRILGALWDSSIFPGRAPEGRALIRAMVGGATDTGILSLDDETIVRTTRADLARTMDLEAEPVFVRVFRHPLGIPQYGVGHLDRLERVAARLQQHAGLYLAGNSYRGISINACIEDADVLARRILGFFSSTRSVADGLIGSL